MNRWNEGRKSEKKREIVRLSGDGQGETLDGRGIFQNLQGEGCCRKTPPQAIMRVPGENKIISSCSFGSTNFKVSEIMETDRLYRVTKRDETKLITLLTECFASDPLYQELIPDEQKRTRLLPELFRCDLDEMLENCEIYAVNEDIDGIVVVSDESEPYNPFKYFAEQLYSAIKTNAFLIRDDPSLETFFNFLRGRDYLNSSWTQELDENRLHVIYLAVRPSCQGKGYAKQLMGAVFDYADQRQMLVSLETHNPKNVSLYRHFGFSLFETIDHYPDLVQYCMVRESKVRRLPKAA